MRMTRGRVVGGADEEVEDAEKGEGDVDKEEEDEEAVGGWAGVERGDIEGDEDEAELLLEEEVVQVEA
jgi:hypothetical protein